MEKIAENLKTTKTKRLLVILLIAVLAGWVVFRFAAVASENSRHVFNAARVAADQGAPVEVITITRTDGILREPIAVKNNRALVSGARVAKLRVGQKIGEGTIVSVSKKIDYDTGMHVVKTSGVSDGLQFAEISGIGFYVPVHAIENNSVMELTGITATMNNSATVGQHNFRIFSCRNRYRYFLHFRTG